MKKKIYTAKRVFMYEEPNEAGHNTVVVKSDLDIRRDFWPWWRKKMRKKWGHKHKLITFNNCVKDWAVVHWATELGVEDKETE